MSIKTFHRPEHDPLLFFLILSILMHMGLAWGLASSSWRGASLFSRPEPAPITVDVVRLPEKKQAMEGPRDIVKLPPLSTQKLSKEKKTPTHASDRSQSVEKETYPEPGRGASLPRPVPLPPGPVVTDKGKVGGVANGAEKPLAGVPDGESATRAEAGGEAYGVPGKGVLDGVKEGVKNGGGVGIAKKPGETIIVPPKPNLFLTEDRIAELTRKYESEPQKGERGKVLQLNTSESKYAKYVNDSLVPPIEFRMGRGTAARKGWVGNLLIDFTVKKDGSLGSIELVRSSGNPALDDDTIISLKLAAPFTPLPAGFEMEEIKIRGIFVYY
ncbi:MAG: energy transducer TonB [Deltaproteobacteria bacterium]|nr:energy transducer TonB [Deltaproteobacteria bacterium]